jgi:hypothetical protein
MVRPLWITGLVVFGMASVSSAQSSSATAGSSTSSASTSGQQDGTASKTGAQAQTKNQDPSTAENKKKPKKVWTNEDVGSRKDGVSVVGAQESGSDSSSCSSCAKPPPYELLVQSYRQKLEPLHSNLADIDRKIQIAKEAKGNAREDTAAWIKVYDGKRKDVLAKMERIEDEARRAGVLPGDLRE